jgi:rhodanese-related sulfurtransferase
MSEFSGTIVDVRTRAEFSGGHVAHSVNIPLQEIMDHVEEIKQMKTPIIFAVHPVEEADKQRTTSNP